MLYIQYLLIQNSLIRSNTNVNDALINSIKIGKPIRGEQNIKNLMDTLKSSNTIVNTIFTQKENEDAWVTSVLANFIPGFGDGKGVIESITGFDLVTKERLAWWEKALGIACLSELRNLRYLDNFSGILSNADNANDIIRNIDNLYKATTNAVGKIKNIISTKVDDLFAEARRIIKYSDSYEVETMEGLKFRISISEIDASKIDDVDDIAAKIARGVFYKNSADPFRDILGSGLQSHPAEWNDIISKIEQVGGKVRYSDNGTMAYSPASQGIPGEIVIDRNASFSALQHEYQHFLDDMASGWSGRRIMYEDFKERIMWELRAYMKEIQEADRLGLQNVSNQLWENYLTERYDLLSRIKPIYQF